MKRPTRLQWWWLVVVAMFIVAAWPPTNGKSLAMKVVNRAVDPWNEMPVLPPQLGFGASDDVEAVNARDAIVRHYDALYLEGGWTRRRLLLKVADDPFDPSTTRQLLIGFGVLSAFVAWRFGAPAPHEPRPASAKAAAVRRSASREGGSGESQERRRRDPNEPRSGES